MNADYDKARDMYEVAMENVYAKAEVIATYLEQLSMELDSVDLVEEDWERLDELLGKAIARLEDL